MVKNKMIKLFIFTNDYIREMCIVQSLNNRISFLI